jgi:hypothetical protein
MNAAVITLDGRRIENPEWMPSRELRQSCRRAAKAYDELQIVNFQCGEWTGIALAGSPWDSIIEKAVASGEPFDQSMNALVVDRVTRHTSMLKSKRLREIAIPAWRN